MADQGDDACLLQERNAPDRAFQQLLKAVIVRRQGRATVLPGHAIDPARQRIGLVAADHQSACLLAHVDQIVRDRAGRECWCGNSLPGDSLEGDVLMIHRGGGEMQPRHGGDLRRPHASRIDHDLGLDRALICHHLLDLALGRKLDPGHAESV